MKKVLALSMGDYNGIGPEIILKAIHAYPSPDTSFVLCGHPSVFKHYAERSGLPAEWKIINEPKEVTEGTRVHLLKCVPDKLISVQPGTFTANTGRAAMRSVEAAIRLCRQSVADAMVTAPISKEAIQLGGYAVPGHTEYLADQTGGSDFLMILASGNLRVALNTIHLPLREVPDAINKSDTERRIRLFHRGLQQDFNIPKPKIAVFGLNPHAGDGGVLGQEEADIISPALNNLRQKGLHVDGPFAADGFFGMKRQEAYDGIFAMYHDQGLAPFKALTFGKGVNITAGLPIVRTSPDHGTAFDIAGTNRAAHSSFLEACMMAESISHNRLAHD
ncbi:MAG: 4-hydroxythreonine-4-phosphate dehydrogenase PdxA [Balneolaceae bacterium]